MEINRFNRSYRIVATAREITLSVFFAGLCGGLILSIATGLLAFRFVGVTAHQTAENKVMLARATGELKNLSFEVATCERRIEACLKGRKK